MQSFKASCRLKTNIWDRTRFFPLSLFHKAYTRGDLISLGTSDVTAAQNLFGFHFVTTTDFFFLFILSTLAMFTINVKLTLISLALFPLIPIFVYFVCEKESRLYEQAQNSLSMLNDAVDSIVGAAKLMKLRPSSPLWNTKLTKAAKVYQSKRKELVTTEAQFLPATALAPAFSVGFFLFFGLRFYKAGLLSTGDLVAFHSYIFMVANPLSELGWLISDWQKSFSSLRRLIALYKRPDDSIFSATEKQKNKTPFEISNLSFSYDPTQPLLSISSLKLDAGERLAIAGDVGSGKSSLGRILAGTEPRYRGQVMFYGTEIRNFTNSILREKIALVDQNPFLFGTTIRENLVLDRNVSDEEVNAWLEVVDLSHDLKSFPNGLNSHLGEWGINLSGGQRQRLTLARALCRRPEVLILDDALSAVDIVTEATIIKRLHAALKDLTVIIISHRPSSLALCNRRFDLTQKNGFTAHV